MKHLVVLFVATALLGSYALAQEVMKAAPKDDPMQTWQGYLVDARTAADLTKNSETAMKSAAEYTKATALKEESRSSGYGIISAGKWLRFDQGGNKQVAEVLKTTKQSKGIMVTVTGRLEGDVLTVSSITESGTEKAPVME